MRIRNITNAFLRVETGPHVLICDPWIRDGVFSGGWAPYPTILDPDGALAGATHCFISHIHEDHCDFAAINRLDRQTVMLVPDIYPNHVIGTRLKAAGFVDIRMVPPATPYELDGGFSVEIIMPMNGFAQEENLYTARTQEPVLAVDAGLIITDESARAVLLSDNSAYSLEDAGASVERMTGCDLLAFPYNSFADDYPTCYDNLTLEQKRAAANERNEKKLQLQAASFQRLKPQLLMPYSSDFVVCGPRALEFVAVQPAEWANKKTAGDRYARETGFPAVAIYERDLLELLDGEWTVQRGVEMHTPPLAEVAARVHRESPNTEVVYSATPNSDTLFADVEAAAHHMFARMDALSIRSEWALELALSEEDGETYTIDLGARSVASTATGAEPRLRCIIDSGYLHAHLDFAEHWNNSMISYNLSWHRVPNVYDQGLYRALNFLHKPLTAERPRER